MNALVEQLVGINPVPLDLCSQVGVKHIGAAR
jgi:hypothetical protein